MTSSSSQQYGTARIVMTDRNSYELELERFVDSDDTILPFYRIPLTGEHLAAWMVGRLGEGFRCKRLILTSARTMASVRRATRKDSGLLYYYVEAVSVTVVHSGKERVVTFALESDEEEDFIVFITDLLCDDPPNAKPV